MRKKKKNILISVNIYQLYYNHISNQNLSH